MLLPPSPFPVPFPQSIIAHASDAKPTRAPSPAARTASQRTSAQELERGRANRAGAPGPVRQLCSICQSYIAPSDTYLIAQSRSASNLVFLRKKSLVISSFEGLGFGGGRGRMRFLCLHGLGTNADIFEAQTAAIREQLGPSHTFDFPEGEYDIPAPKEITAVYPPPYLSWHPPHTLDTHIAQGLTDIRTYIADNGPYDACLGFSQGAVMLALLLLEDAAANLSSSDSTTASNNSSTTPPPSPRPPLFQLAIFLSGSLYPLADPLLARGARISIPTTHIWGGKRDYVTTNGAGEALRDAC
ncbi:hypothetical protein V497_02198, partial [Pseudogymnoascus sp. VKM F-4516 (FW-969)]